MTINPLQATSSSTIASAIKEPTKGIGDYKAFLQLLITELKNQDPTKPADPTQMVTQLATFSSLEQAVKTNDLLSALGQQSSLTQGAGLIGRTMTSADGSTTGQVASVTIDDKGMRANLVNGGRIMLGSGVSIS
jgi:flagellar basal-body rod modification protein FlgD